VVCADAWGAYMAFAFLRVLIACLFAAFVVREVLRGVSTGVLRIRGGTLSRQQQPVGFWFFAAAFLGLACGLLYFAVRLLARAST
jgi:hypothetical protein